MKKIKFGIVGIGNQGNYYANLFNAGKIKNAQLVAVCDNNPVKIDNAKQKFGLDMLYYSNYKDLILDKVCDAILVVTPHYFHPEVVIECLKHDVNVISDKPLGVYAKQLRQISEVAKTSKAKFSVMFNQRTNCVYRKMKELISSGALGQLQRMTWIITDWFRTQAYYNGGSWRATWAGEGGGVLINQCPHQIDLVQWVLGEMPVKVSSFCHYGKWHDIEVEDDVTAYFEYANGATGTFVTSTGEAPGVNRLEVSGSKGRLVCQNEELVWYKNDRDSIDLCRTTQKVIDTPACERIVVETDGKNPQHEGILNNFTNALLGIEDLFVDGIEGFKGVELMNAIELSGWRGGALVTLPINDDEYLAELNKHRANSKTKVGNDNAVVEDMGSTFGSVIK